MCTILVIEPGQRVIRFISDSSQIHLRFISDTSQIHVRSIFSSQQIRPSLDFQIETDEPGHRLKLGGAIALRPREARPETASVF